MASQEAPAASAVAIETGLATSTQAPSSRPDSFVSAPTTPLETTESTPATTISGASDQDKHASQWQAPADGVHKVVIPQPLPTAVPKVPAPLSAEHQAAYETVLAAVSEWTQVPETTARNAPLAPMKDSEYMWLTRECLLRYLRASKWHVQTAIKRLQSTLSWRREYGADDFSSEYISPENETGKQFLLGFDNDGRPCWYMNPSRQNTKMSDRQIHHVSYMLDRAIDLMPPGQETVALLCSYKDAPRGSVPTVSIGRQALNVLQNHNPERLGRCLMQDWPWFMSAFYKLITPFIDPLTKEKIKFDEDLRLWVPPEHLWTAYGGDMKFDYDHALYWPSLKEEAARRRAAYTERWVAGGKLIGEHEAYLRGGDHKSLRETQAADTAALTAQTADLKVEA